MTHLEHEHERETGRLEISVRYDGAIDELGAACLEAVHLFLSRFETRVGGAIGSTLETEVDDWDFTFAVLVRSVFLGIKHGARVMVEQGSGGSIINTASVAALSGGAGPVAYSAAKAAVVNLSRATAVELAEQKIRVNAICPGAIDTPMSEKLGEGMIKGLMAATPLARMGTADEVAALALFLSSDEGSFITGQAISPNGGIHIA